MIKINLTSKKELGERFARFRTFIGKTQKELSKELGVRQTAVTHIENGTTAPALKYVLYLKENYALDVNWMLTGKGSIKSTDNEDCSKGNGNCPLFQSCITGKDPDYESFKELFVLMKVPIIRYGVFLRLKELKALVKEDGKIVLSVN
jgi:transcriptional regulator with XRE-family HTH domain